MLDTLKQNLLQEFYMRKNGLVIIIKGFYLAIS